MRALLACVLLSVACSGSSNTSSDLSARADLSTSSDPSSHLPDLTSAQGDFAQACTSPEGDDACSSDGGPGCAPGLWCDHGTCRCGLGAACSAGESCCYDPALGGTPCQATCAFTCPG